MCSIVGCRNYSGQFMIGFCDYHIHRFALAAVIREELWKHKRVAKPVHNKIVKNVRY